MKVKELKQILNILSDETNIIVHDKASNTMDQITGFGLIANLNDDGASLLIKTNNK